MSRSRKIFIAFVVLIAVAILAGGVWYFLFFRIVSVPGGSMANTIIPGDRVLCSIRATQVERGDLIIFKYPPDPRAQYIMRVVGLSGETIQLRGTRVFINSRELPEARTFVELSDVKGSLKEISSEGEGKYRVYYGKRESDDVNFFSGQKYALSEPFLIPQGQYFVLGDSRDNSFDSRYWGTVPRELITGKALMIVSSDSTNGDRRSFKRLW